MRAIVDEINFGDFNFLVEFDSGGHPEYPYCVWISHNNQPLLYKDSDIQVRRYFHKEFNQRHFNNFCIKFSNDAEYRNKYILEERGIKD